MTERAITGNTYPIIYPSVDYVDLDGKIVIHRVVRLEEATLVTKGDNRDHDAPPVPFERMLGKVET